jgi:GT2 family glycosyltransferase
MSRVGVVVIGRNEGARLHRCLDSVAPGPPIVYVDSGSTDGSPDAARQRGVDVIDLDLSVPFTAARARNAGWRRLEAIAPDAEYVQFVDGDCQLDPDWLPRAEQYLDDHPGVAVACGRLREFHPNTSVYNKLCDLEWDTPVGPADSSGGIAMMRLASLRQVDGFRDDLIAGEEPELCLRLRDNGGAVHRIDAEMARHDAAMTRFGQWWKRAVRAGHAYAEVSHLTRQHPTGLWRREAASAWFWGVILPLVAFGMAWPTKGWSLLLLSGYGVLAFRVWTHARSRWSAADAALATRFGVIAKFAHAAGSIRYWSGRALGSRRELIEYKTADPVS